MLFDFGFNLEPNVEEIKARQKKIALGKRLYKCMRRIGIISQGKIYSRSILTLLREELDLRDELIAAIGDVQKAYDMVYDLYMEDLNKYNNGSR